jgi:exonuclease VII small subunit
MLGNTNTWRKILKILCQLVDGENVKKATKRMKSLVKKLAKCTKDLEQDQKKLNAAIRELTKCVTKCKTHFNMTTDEIIKLTPEGVEASLGETSNSFQDEPNKEGSCWTGESIRSSPRCLRCPHNDTIKF